MKFRDLHARQARKTDLVDMCRALGTAAGDAWPLPQVRDAIRAKLPAAELDDSRQASKKDLLGIASALGCDLHSRPKGERMPTEELRAWIHAMLIQRGQGSPVFHAGELVVIPNGQRAVVLEQGARVEVRLLVGHGPIEHYWPGELKGTGERA